MKKQKMNLSHRVWWAKTALPVRSLGSSSDSADMTDVSDSTEGSAFACGWLALAVAEDALDF